MRPVKYHPHARSEVIDSALFYDGRSHGLGERFLQAVESTEVLICQHPLLGQPYEAGTRKCRVKRFPFALIYKESSGGIMVYAVAHFSRRPGYWTERL
jgi:hypothetical protein